MDFMNLFQCITGYPPFPWQVRLFEKFSAGEFPASASIPTGLGKTSVVVIWLIALALHPDKVPRRLVYVVNRRTVVDQTTAEVEKMRQAMADKAELVDLTEKLRNLCALPLPSPESSPLAISTLRGQFADNREWSADPARPAVIIGTVDMIGSGLLFSRYTVGYKLRPHHAAFLAQDALLVHDEAHLEPAFQTLLDSIVAEQSRCDDPRKLRVIELTATTRSNTSSETFRLSEDDHENEFVSKRLNAVKKLILTPLGEEKEQDKITELALGRRDSGRATLVFVRSVVCATKIAAEIGKKIGVDKVLTLTGTMRGKERDELIRQAVFKRFLPSEESTRNTEDTVFLVATSAGEVGVNISAGELICDLSTYESMAQRFGRVNRFGECEDSTITVVYPTEFPHTKKIQEAEKAVAEGKKDAEKKLQAAIDKAAIEVARERTLTLLHLLNSDASPAALECLPVTERAGAFSPLPRMRIATAIQFDAWALTSIHKPMAARPPVAPYLHGEAEWQPPETHLVWRDDPDVIGADLMAVCPPDELLEDYPIKPHELLRDTTIRVVEALTARLEKLVQGNGPSSFEKIPAAWLLADNGELEILPLISSAKLYSAYQKGKDRSTFEKDEIKRHQVSLETLLADATIILPSSIGGISEQGIFAADGRGTPDVSSMEGLRRRLYSPTPFLPDEYASGYRLIRVIDTLLGDESDDSPESANRYWLWLEAKNAINAEKRSTTQPETLASHIMAVVANAMAIAGKVLPVPIGGGPDLRRSITAGATKHDDGKDCRQWQLGIGNFAYDPAHTDTILAKPGGSMRSRQLAENYRHEFGSLINASVSPDILALSPVERDLALHLVTAHHGRSRPHFPVDEVFDYSVGPETTIAHAIEVPIRFARLQQRFGRWGLAWLESLLRAADYAASAGIVAETSVMPDAGYLLSEQIDTTAYPLGEKARITIRVDVANPGHYFACCGLFELAARLAPGAQAYFEQDETTQQWLFVIVTTNVESKPSFTLHSLFEKITQMDIAALEPDDAPKTPLTIGAPFNLVIDWWRYEGGKAGKLKTWAGQMGVSSIANDMKQTLKLEIGYQTADLGSILYRSTTRTEGQPYYFDANYAVNAQAQDVGFSIDKLWKGGVKIKTAVVPAVELLCLIGLQRARPILSFDVKGKERLYDYRVWCTPLSIALVPAVISGALTISCKKFRFANPSRAKDYRAFMPAVCL